MKVLVVGSGGREHALAWKLCQSPRIARLYCAPGNAGTASIAESVPISDGDLAALADWAESNQIDLTVVGPEDPLTRGIVDLFSVRGLRIFGPSGPAAEIEGSKSWAKELMFRKGIPTARSVTLDDYDLARDYLLRHEMPVVVKADGLARGKGVTVARTRDEAINALDDCMRSQVFGEAGNRVVIEECLVGKEVSILALTDGANVEPLVPACDYKAIQDGDRGPNTGGVGSYAPPAFVDADLIAQIRREVLEPTISGMVEAGRPYRGILYAGLMITSDGLKVLEYNARFGDPETQVVLPLLDCDLIDLALASIEKRVVPGLVRTKNQFCCGVVLTSAGYPGHYETGKPISGLDSVDRDVAVFHAGTRFDGERIVTAGGRVLSVVATGSTMAEARAIAYDNVARITFEGVYYRKDVALREVR